jgi:Phospholipase_D-nuclease N-terminal
LQILYGNVTYSSMELTVAAAVFIAFQIYAIWNVLHEPWEGYKKLIWIVVILVFNVAGTAVYLLFFRTTKTSLLP